MFYKCHTPLRLQPTTCHCHTSSLPRLRQTNNTQVFAFSRIHPIPPTRLEVLKYTYSESNLLLIVIFNGLSRNETRVKVAGDIQLNNFVIAKPQRAAEAFPFYAKTSMNNKKDIVIIVGAVAHT